jgi:hypothetical protein
VVPGTPGRVIVRIASTPSRRRGTVIAFRAGIRLASLQLSMARVLRVLAAIAFAIAFALPGVTDEGGENGSGTGVWVLPSAACAPVVCGVPREVRTVPCNVDCVMRVSSDCGHTGATFVDDMTGLPVALQVSGSQVRLAASLLQALAGAARPTATVLIVDGHQFGYALTITVNAGGTATIRVY